MIDPRTDTCQIVKLGRLDGGVAKRLSKVHTVLATSTAHFEKTAGEGAILKRKTS